MEPLVSICTTTYQHSRYIRQTLLSEPENGLSL